MSTLLRILQLSSPTLPIGAYAYSQGVESAVHRGHVVDEPTAYEWLKDVLMHGLLYNDMALVAHFYRAWEAADAERLARLAQLSTALRETHELKQEDLHVAKALMRLADPLGVDLSLYSGRALTYPLVFAGFAQQWHSGLKDSLTAFTWSWVENQVAAMIKLVPLGQTQGQILIMKMDAEIEKAIEAVMVLAEEEIGSGLPGFAILSCQHETQYTRLFRS
ncbi:MAG: urease accessory protein UreF [Hydrogenovibrio sp.]|nr:urease accessory protein UreF [Hydrogenovibrio sp.]